MSRSHRLLTAAACVAFFGAACSSRRTVPNTLAYYDNAGASCVVATLDGFAVRKADVEALRKFYTRPLGTSRLTQLAVDSTLAAAIVADGDWKQTSVAHRARTFATLRSSAAGGAERFDEARQELGLRRGPCYVP